ncbi:MULTISPECIES: succinate dehydrogenase, hydrophobic membrane anchor protein [unclassified Endozoicomonas]|uniref:succinate dehydrogenase, hydrophobic membrane anchor protein n=1 Tax=unclassified Endozoicomonas TaxID=2644528 RepID=UPI0021483943|nr:MULTISPECIES: succinate dehydrogenase, hydrophobic membrane anchor protein [unclassified Endozoicomonas]
MVTNITNLSRSGLYDWMLQRLSAIILAAYTLFIGGYVLVNPGLDFQQWNGLFEQAWVKVFTLLAILSIAAHAWVGMWTIATDYLNARAFGSKSVLIRFPFQLICFVAVFSYIVWGIQILWGN